MSQKKPHGHTTWYFPDGDLPPHGGCEPHGHESLVILNPHDTDAELTITVYYPDREPDVIPTQRVDARRVRCFRTDEPIDGYQVSSGQYALKIEATSPVICQIGRMDVRQPNLAYYTVMGHPA
jgi:hypothetical protein